MYAPKIRYSKRTCFVYKNTTLIGKMQFQKDPKVNIWRIVYLSADLPINSSDRPCDIHEKLCDNGLTWRWGKIYHCYSYLPHVHY